MLSSADPDRSSLTPSSQSSNNKNQNNNNNNNHQNHHHQLHTNNHHGGERKGQLPQQHQLDIIDDDYETDYGELPDTDNTLGGRPISTSVSSFKPVFCMYIKKNPNPKTHKKKLTFLIKLITFLVPSKVNFFFQTYFSFI